METANTTRITVQTTVNAPAEKVWNFFTTPEHITQWNSASPDWHSPHAENDLRAGGKFSFRMEAKDGSFGFDFGGVYDDVQLNERIEYTLEDSRKVTVEFKSNGSTTELVETFEAEDANSIELQQMGWQAILDNFKRHVEAN